MWYVGLDLGQAADSTALAMIEEPVWIPGRGWCGANDLTADDRRNLAEPQLRYLWAQQAPKLMPLWLRGLTRFPLLTPYPAIVEDVIRMLGGKDAQRPEVILIVDGTGVGAAVVDMFRYGDLPCEMYNLIITGAAKAERNHVPKRDLIGALQVSLQRGQLVISKDTDETKTLVSELQNYRVAISDRGHDSYNARSGKHDDLVLAAALATWYARMMVHRGEL